MKNRRSPVRQPPMFAAALIIVTGLLSSLSAADDFHHDLRPLLRTYCYECHGTKKAERDLDYESLSDTALLSDADLLDTTLWMVEENEMPTKQAKQQMGDRERMRMMDMLQHGIIALRDVAPNDPGVVVAPRLNHSEYNYVVRDLTGLDVDLGQYLVPENEHGEGFINVGAAQNMTVGQFEAYLSTAKKLLLHAIITPDTGINWQMMPMPPSATAAAGFRKVLADQWQKWHAKQWSDFFENHQRTVKKQLDMFLGAYFEAAWRYHHRAKLGMPDASFDDIAKDYDVRLITNAVRVIYEDLTKHAEDKGLLVQWLSERWLALPAPSGRNAETARDGCRELEEWIDQILGGHWGGLDDYSGRIDPYEVNDKPNRQKIRGEIHHGTWPYIIDLNRTEGRDLYFVVTDAGDGNQGDIGLWENGIVHFGKKQQKPLHELGLRITAVSGDTPRWQDGRLRVQAPSVLKMTMPADATTLTIDLSMAAADKETASLQTVIFDHPPETLGFIPGRGLPGARLGGFPRAKAITKSAGYLKGMDRSYHKHPRDQHAFRSWSEDLAHHYDIPWPQNDQPRGAFGPLPDEIYTHLDQSQLAELEHMKQEAISAAQPALHNLAKQLQAADIEIKEGVLPDDQQLAKLNTDAKLLLHQAQTTLAKQEQQARAMLQPFVERAWRRPISDTDVDRLMSFYRESRQGGTSFGGALKVSLSAALIHPHFLYRFMDRNPTDGLRPLNGRELAERLSFTLWGSLPDAELLELGDQLQNEAELTRQLERLRSDERAIALAKEFAAHWLQFHNFANVAQPDSERFDDFPEVKSDMVREVELFFADLFRNNRPITNVIDSDYVFVNKRLANWYGIDGVKHQDFRKVQLDGEAAQQRGGIFGMGAVLVKYSEPLRTSPVRRGAWVHEHILGIHLPGPPANVPPISDDERNEEGQSIREQLEEHRQNPACFSCHDKIDPPGIALEKFDPVGRWREQDLAKEAIDDQGTFIATKTTLDGVVGLREFILETEQEQFLKNFCKELLGYCLGRMVEPTDQPLLDQMMASLKSNELRPAAALQDIVLSQQFRHRRNAIL